MKKALKWIGIILGGLVGLIVLGVAAAYVVSNSRLNKTYDVRVESLAIPTGEEVVARGENLAVTRGCTDCHGENLAGGIFIDDPALGKIYAANLTSGAGGAGSSYSDEDWVRSIRHGVRPDGTPLVVMPSNEFYFLSDDDLGAILAYLQTIPAVDNVNPDNNLMPIGRVLFATGQLGPLAADVIDHTSPRPEAPEVGVTEEYGEYLAIFCAGCHGPDFTGGPAPGSPPDGVPAANLTPAGDLADWSESDFIETLRSGTKPNGDPLDEAMPYRAIGQMSDTELQAIWLYLQSLPAIESDAS